MPNLILWDVLQHVLASPIVSMGGVVGFDMTNIEYLLRVHGFPPEDDLVNLEKIREATAAAVKAINANAEQKSKNKQKKA